MTDPIDPPDSPKPNLIMPVPPLFASIMAPRAARLVKQLCKVKGTVPAVQWINTVREIDWNKGPGNENLAQVSLNVGTVGMVVGVSTVSTVLRFMVTTGNQNEDGIYHVSVMNLEPMEELPEQDP